MTRTPFIKMHGAGNDYVFVDGFETTLPANPSLLSKQISNRNFGIGSDGLVLIDSPENSSADVRLRMWNADGSEGSMCGNAARCVALWLELKQQATGRCVIETATRIVEAETLQLDANYRRGEFCVDLGEPAFDLESANKQEWLSDISLADFDFKKLPFIAVSMGNPHAVFFVEDLSDEIVHKAGAAIESHDRFPDGTNVEWAQVTAHNEITVRVWERGSGETLACGSGACAAAVAAIEAGKCDRDQEVSIKMQGGRLRVEWRASGQVRLSGPAAVSFVGEF